MISEKDISIIKEQLKVYLKNDNDIVDELTSVSLLKIARYKYYNNTNNKNYNALLKIVAKSVFFSYHRKQATKKNKLLVFCEIDSISSYNADDKINKQEQEYLVNKIFSFLTERQREVVLMKYYLGLNYREISEILNCSINTALGAMQDAKVKIRKKIIRT